MITALLLLLAIPGPRFEKISEGVYAALQADGERFNDCNSVVLVNADGVTVVDTFTSPATARWLLDEIARTGLINPKRAGTEPRPYQTRM